tara:strand:- start:328 stop:3462 length:3135 start_codon:yes stop_codon:yes gene_type:complete
MSNDRGVFTLGAYRRAQVEGQGVDINDVWLSPSYGVSFSYFAGGRVPGPNYVTIVDKLQFSSDSIARSPSADLDYDSYNRNPVASSTAAYWMSGSKNPSEFGPSSWSSKTSKTTYSTDTTAASPNFPNSGGAIGWESLGSTATETAAYTGGGMPTPMYSRTYLWKLDFSTDGFSSLPNFPQEQGQTGDALGNQTHGYWSGGIQKPSGSPNSYGAYTMVVKYTYSTDTFSNAGTLPGPRKKVAASGNATEGYIYGGIDGHPSGSATWHTTAIKLTYATDTTSLNPSNLAENPRTETRGSGNTSSGYVVGAGNPSTNTNVFKFDYSTGTQSTPGSLKRPVVAREVANASSQSYGIDKYPLERWTDGFKEDDLKAGYYQGGGNPSSNSATQKVSFVTDQTSIVPGGSLPQNGSAFAGVNSNSTKTIISGGEPGGEAFMKFVYNTETSSNLTGSMPSRRWINNDMGYGTESLGYVTGGMSEPSNPGFYHSGTQKIEYATDTASDVPGANSNQPLREMGAFGNVDHTIGYLVGGIIKSPTAAVSRIQKMTYSTETIANTPANMQNNYFNLGTTTGPDAGYIYSKQEYPGYSANGAIEKFVYATDSRTTVPQPSYYPSYGANGTGNSTNGYYAGGNGGGGHGNPNRYTRILKLNFSTGVGQDMPSSLLPIPSGVYRSAASSAVARKKSPKGAPVPTPTPGYDPGNYELAAGVPNHGYYMGGNGPNDYGNTNSMKMNFATDTLSTGVQLSEKYRSGNQGSGGKTASSPSHAYVIQGLAPSNTGNTYVRKIQYSNDTASNAPNTPSQPSWGSAIAGRTTNLYKAGGHDHANIPLQTRTGILKLTYASDTWNQISQGNAGYSNPSGWPRQSFASGGTQEYALWSQSSPNDYRSSISKFTYATDTGVMNIPGATYPNTEQTLQVGNSNDTHWYMARGNTPSGPFQSKISKFTFSTDTWEFGTLTDSTYDYGDTTGSASINNGMFAGYWAGGHKDQQDATSTMKLTYSSETVAKGPNIPAGRYSPSPDNSGGGNMFTGTSVQEWGNGGTRVPNVV